MFDWVYSAPLGIAALTMAVIFVGFTWAGSIFVAPILRVFVRSRSGTSGIVGNILSVNGGEKVGHVAAQNQASGAAPSAMARALVT